MNNQTLHTRHGQKAIAMRAVITWSLLCLLFCTGGCATTSPPLPDPTRAAPPPYGRRASEVVQTPTGSAIVRTARALIGTPYQWGGTTPDTGFDCSGFVRYVYARHGIDLPRSSSQLLSTGQTVKNALHPGDIVIYRISKKQKGLHVGIATGQGTFVHSPSSGKGVSESSLSTPYWTQRYLGARRALELSCCE